MLPKGLEAAGVEKEGVEPKPPPNPEAEFEVTIIASCIHPYSTKEQSIDDQDFPAAVTVHSYFWLQ